MHKMTMEENYSIEEIMQSLLPEETEPEISDYNYTECMEGVTQTEDRVEESNDLWEPVRRLIEKARRRRVGYVGEDL